MASFIAREEEFGAVLCQDASDEAILLNKVGFSVFRQIASGMSDWEILQAEALEKDKRLTEDDVASLRLLYTDGIHSSISSNFVNRSAKSFPALRAPLDLYWEITRRCNENCVHCYNNSGTNGYNPPLEKLMGVVSELARHPLRSISLTGGEPMMRRDFFEFASAVRPLTRYLNLGTNGTLVTEQNVEQLSELIDLANISIDTADPKAFDAFRRYPGAFEKTTKGVRLLRESGVDVTIQTVLDKESIDRVYELGNLLVDLNVTGWSVRFPFFSGRAQSDMKNKLSRNDIREYMGKLEECRRHFSKQIPDVKMGGNYPWSYEEPYRFTENPDQLVTCAASTISAALTVDGRLSPCSLFTETDYKSGPVWGDNFLSEWKTAQCFVELRNLTLRDIQGCGTCANATTRCGTGCRAKAYMKSGSVRTNDYDCSYSRNPAEIEEWLN